MKKKLFSLLLIAVMVLASVSSAFAATLTVTPAAGDNGTHTYSAWQVIKGDVTTETYTEDGVEKTREVLSNVQWGEGAKEQTDGKINNVTATEFAEELAKKSGEEATTYVQSFLKATAPKTATSTNGSSAVFENLEKGYYFINDVATTADGQVASQTKFITKLLKDDTLTVAAKASVPSVVKKTQDINDSDATPALTNLQDSADYDIGDTVPYTVTATIGTGIANYKEYSFQFVDTMSKGLTLDESSWDIKVGDKSIKSLFTLKGVDGAEGAKVWTWAATNIKPEIADGSKVVLTYNCVLNKDAVVGSAGNPNTVTLKFDNNPNNCGKGTPEGETPEDTNIVFTYKTIFNKVDGDNKPLAGADFKLEKKVNGAWVDVTTLGSGENKPTKTGSTAGTKFEFSGLDDGDYRLTEIATPQGYNTIDPIEFTITATHDITSDNPQLTALTGTDGKEFEMTANVSAGSLTDDIINRHGSTLPETGGIGTTIIYILGAALVIGAGVMLVTRKKMND